MPEPLYNENCRDASLREIVTYKRPCNECCDCSPKTVKKQQKGGKKTKFRRHRKRSKKCCDKDNSCPQRIEEMALPLNRRVEVTLQYYSDVLDTERVIKVCKLIHELQNPKPKPPSLMKTKRKKRRCLRARACCKSAKLKEQWLEKQTCRSGDKFIRYLTYLRRMIPNYKQLQVTMMLYKLLNFRKLRTCNRFVKEELKVICQKLAILIDVKLQPYKQEFVVDQISCTSLEDKHCIFEMFEYVPPESEEETELVYEEEGSVLEEGSMFQGEGIVLSEWEPEEEITAGGVLIEEIEEGEESEGSEGGEGGEGGEGEEGGESEEGGEGYEGGEGETMGSTITAGGMLSEEEESAAALGKAEEIGEGTSEEEILEEGKVPKAGDLAEISEEYEEEEEGLLEAEEEEEVIKAAGPFEEEESVMIGVEEVEEEEAVSEEAGLPDFHPDGTSSYIDWCLYVSWLKELGRNIEMYASCLQQFRATLQADEASKFEETIRFILKNWSNYLGESRAVDQNMTQYFKDKPMTWCTMCRDCTIDDYPAEHYIPPELAEVIRTTKYWRRLLAEAEEYCNLLSKKPREEEGAASSVEEIYEIFDVGSSSSSSYDILALDAPRRSKSK